MKSDLTEIPGVGVKIAQALINLGYPSISSLKGQNAEEMFEKDCELRGCRLDPCLLYVYRLAVYFADNDIHDPEKLKWWNWKIIEKMDKRKGLPSN